MKEVSNFLDSSSTNTCASETELILLSSNTNSSPPKRERVSLGLINDSIRDEKRFKISSPTSCP